MVREVLFQAKHIFSQISFRLKKKDYKRLTTSFGHQKTESFDFEAIENYFRSKRHLKSYQVISNKTCNDLDFDDVFMFLDRTHSKVGQQYLYDRLRVIERDDSRIRINEELIEEFSKDEKFRVSVQKYLEKLRHAHAYDIRTLFQEEHVRPPKWFFVLRLLSLASVFSLGLSFFIPSFVMVLLALFCTNFVFHYWNKNNLLHYVNLIPQVLRLQNVALFLFSQTHLKKVNPNLSASLNLLDKVKNRMLFFRLEARLQGEFEIIAWFVFDLIKTLFLLEPLLLFGVLKRLEAKRNAIEDVFQFVGHIDMLISIASLRKSLNTYCVPDVIQNNLIKVQDMSHPLIKNCTANSINIKEKSILLTGSNMSGKTSFIRAIGLNVITGLTINTCFARAMSFPLMKIFSAIRISDDLLNHKSYYFEEVLTIKEMLNESKREEKKLFLLDEIFKGTNTVERIAAGKAVLSSLIKGENKILVSTHDIELADMLSSEYELYHFSETVDDQTVGFDYKLKTGKLKNRNAIRILEINNYPKEVVEEALNITKELDESLK